MEKLQRKFTQMMSIIRPWKNFWFLIMIASIILMLPWTILFTSKLESKKRKSHTRKRLLKSFNQKNFNLTNLYKYIYYIIYYTTNIYIMFILFLWHLSTLCVLDHLWQFESLVQEKNTIFEYLEEKLKSNTANPKICWKSQNIVK